jgi:hypothetical protein
MNESTSSTKPSASKSTTEHTLRSFPEATSESRARLGIQVDFLKTERPI